MYQLTLTREEAVGFITSMLGKSAAAQERWDRLEPITAKISLEERRIVESSMGRKLDLLFAEIMKGENDDTK